MLYMLLLYSRPDIAFPADGMQRHISVYEDTTSKGQYVISEALGDGSNGKVVRNHEGGVVTDGPFVETKEFLGGFYLLECRDLDEAIDLARRIPAVERGSVEIRPILELPAEYATAAAAMGSAG